MAVAGRSGDEVSSLDPSAALRLIPFEARRISFTVENMGRLRQLDRRLGRMPARIAARPKVAERFYTSPEWRRLVASIKRTRGNWCERCGAGGKGVRVIGDHVVERRDGGAELDPANIELLCAACHNRKTAEAKAARVRRGGG